MSVKVRIQSRVEDGKLVMNRDLLNRSLIQFEQKNIVVQIELWNKKMSEKQRGYYFGVICSLVKNAILQQWGEHQSLNWVHEMLKTECNYEERVNPNTGEIRKFSQSTKLHTTVEQENYHTKCREWASEWLNIDIPLPNEQMEIDVK